MSIRPIPQPRPWYPSHSGDWSPEWYGWVLIGAAVLLLALIVVAFVVAPPRRPRKPTP